jgi:eukaryotic-like serine/threonine-protein kinase
VNCPFCGAATQDGEPCDACLARFADYESSRTFAGDYELLGPLGEGGTAVVYLGRHRVSGEAVAIKHAKPALLAVPQGAELFVRQARIESSLRHPNIVRVYGTGEHDGRPFLVMPLLEGGTLSEPQNLARFTTLTARLELMLKIARAVQAAHAHGVLHCDLKPDNILFDAQHEPHVSDFGFARAVGSADAGGFHAGALGWMSPEQVRRRPLTTASDVFALGVMLYWLVTGELPFGAGEDFERRVVWSSAPSRPPYRPGLGWGLIAIAHHAMRIARGKRYQTVAELVRDLERLRDDETLLGPKVPLASRAFTWAARHPGARNALFLLLPCFAAVTLAAAKNQRDELRQSALDMNGYAASGQAAAVLYQLREYGDTLERAADDPGVRALVSAKRPLDGDKDNPCAEQTSLSDPEALRQHRQGFSTLVALNEDACVRARVADEPLTLAYMRRPYRPENWGNVRALGEHCKRVAWVRQAYRSSVSHLMKFALTMPLFERTEDPRRCRFLGAVSGSLLVTSTLDLPRIRRSGDRDRTTVLLGPFEGENPEHAPPSAPEFTILAHPRLGHGQKVTLDPVLAAELARKFPAATAPATPFDLRTATPLYQDEHVDPLWGDRWFGAFAPVGQTGYVVLVQTREAAALRPTAVILRIGWALIGAAAVLLAAWGLFSLWRHVAERSATLRFRGGR